MDEYAKTKTDLANKIKLAAKVKAMDQTLTLAQVHDLLDRKLSTFKNDICIILGFIGVTWILLCVGQVVWMTHQHRKFRKLVKMWWALDEKQYAKRNRIFAAEMAISGDMIISPLRWKREWRKEYLSDNPSGSV